MLKIKLNTRIYQRINIPIGIIKVTLSKNKEIQTYFVDILKMKNLLHF